MSDDVKQIAGAAAIGFVTGGIGFAGGAFTFSTSAALSGAFTSMALTAASKALAPKPSTVGLSDQQQTITARQPNATRKLAYGENRVGGTMVHLEATDDDQYLHMVIVLAAHEVDAIETVYFDDEELTISGNDTTSPDKYDGLVKIYKVTKGSSGATPSALINDTSWTSGHVLNDQAYLYVRLEYSADAFPTGIPNISALVRGRKVYDTRSENTAFSRNPAMIIRDYLLDQTYGLGATSAEIDENAFIAAANVCDETVTLDEGGTESRYLLDGRVDTGNTPKSNIEDLLTAMNGALYYVNGKWAVKAGAYSTPTVTLDEDDLAGNVSITTANSARDSFNAIKGQFVSPDTEFQPSDYPEITSSTFESEDNSERRYINLDLPYTTSSSMAQRIAKQVLFKNRQEVTMTARFKLTAFQFQVGDTIMITNERMGFSAKPFEVVNWQLVFTEEQVAVDCVLSETNAAVYAWDAEEAVFQQDNTTLPSGVSPPTPQNLTLTATAVVNDDGITIPAIQVDWDVVNAGFVQYYEIQYKRLGGEEDYGLITVTHTESENWGLITDSFTSEEDYGLVNEPILTPDAQYNSVLGTTNSFTIIPVLNGYDYNVRVRSINAFGARSQFTTATLASAGDTTPPGAPSLLTVNELYKALELTWTNPGDQDLDYIEIWENTVDNLSTADLIGTISGTRFLRGGLPNNETRYYWVRAVDLSLNKSDYTAEAEGTTLLIEPNDFNDAVNDLFQEAGAFGIEPVDNLPASGDFDGQLVLLKSDLTLYRWDSATSAWSTELFTASNVDPGSITSASFASGIEPVSVVNGLPSPTGYDGPSVVFNTVDNKLYRYNGTQFTAAISTQDLSGELGEGLFSDTLRPIERVASLPTTNLTQGRVVLLTTDNKLYRYTGNEWTTDIAATDITGQLIGNQIADGSINSTKIVSNAVTAAKIANGSVESDKLASNAVTSVKISNNAVTSPKIVANAIVADKISSNAVVADKIASDAVTAAKIDAGAVTADKVAANAITANKIASNAVVADKIASNSISSDKIQSNAITAAKITSGAISADKIASNAVTAGKVAADAITAGTIAAGAINASDLFVSGVIQSGAIGTGQIVTNNLAASSVISSKIGAGAVTANKISVSELSAISADLGTIEVGTANIADAAVTNAKIGDTIQSSNYSSGSTGWRIKKDGSAEFNGVVISRQLQVASGSHSIGTFSIPNVSSARLIDRGYRNNNFDIYNTGINISSWAGTNKTYIAAIGISSATVFVLSGQTANSYWGFEAKVLPLTRFSGTAQLGLHLEFFHRNVTSVQNCTITWKIYEVT